MFYFLLSQIRSVGRRQRDDVTATSQGSKARHTPPATAWKPGTNAPQWEKASQGACRREGKGGGPQQRPEQEISPPTYPPQINL